MLQYLSKCLLRYKFSQDLEEIVGDMKGEMLELMFVYQDIQDKLFDIDRTWQNSLVFYGLKQESGCVYESADCTESKVSQTSVFTKSGL